MNLNWYFIGNMAAAFWVLLKFGDRWKTKIKIDAEKFTWCFRSIQCAWNTVSWVI